MDPSPPQATLVSTAQSVTSFSHLLDLANENVGGKALYANDDFFAPKEDLIKASVPVFIAGKYTEFGKWMDGWESRRKRVLPGQDFCIIQLGFPGVIEGVNIDTSFFTGNYPEYAALEGIEAEDTVTLDDLKNCKWTELLAKAPLAGGSHNLFSISSNKRWTHLKLTIFPDGGVARLRVHGKSVPLAKNLKSSIDVAAAQNGALVITANDMYFGPKDNLILPGRAKNMGEGWETRRKRGPGNDWIIIKLAGKSKLSKIEVDTNHFKGNFPDRCSVEALSSGELLLPCDFRDRTDLRWTEILPQQKLKPHEQHYFEKELKNLDETFDYIRLSIYPDGGISRFRVTGVLV